MIVGDLESTSVVATALVRCLHARGSKLIAPQGRGYSIARCFVSVEALVALLQQRSDQRAFFGQKRFGSTRSASFRAPSSWPFTARIAARTASAPGGSSPVTRRSRNAANASLFRPRRRHARPSVARACQFRGSFLTSTSASRSAASARHPKRRAAIADKHPDCGLLCHRATTGQFQLRSFALEPSFRPRAQDATARRTRPGLSARF